GLEGADGAIELAPLLRVLDGHLERPRRGTDAVHDRGDAETVHGRGDRACRVARAEATRRRLGERDRGELARSVDGRGRRDLQTGRVALDDEGAELAFGRGGRDDEHVSGDCVRYVRLLTGDAPITVVDCGASVGGRR